MAPPPLPARFTIDVAPHDLDDLARRLAEARWPVDAPDGWQRGADPRFLRELVAYWRTTYDWRSQEERLNQLA